MMSGGPRPATPDASAADRGLPPEATASSSRGCPWVRRDTRWPPHLTCDRWETFRMRSERLLLASSPSTGIASLEQVARHSQEELLAIHGVGPKAIRILGEAGGTEPWIGGLLSEFASSGAAGTAVMMGGSVQPSRVAGRRVSQESTGPSSARSKSRPGLSEGNDHALTCLPDSTPCPCPRRAAPSSPTWRSRTVTKWSASWGGATGSP
jgi:hypothetical protein